MTENAPADEPARRVVQVRVPQRVRVVVCAVPGGTVMGRVSVGFPQPDAVDRESSFHVHV